MTMTKKMRTASMSRDRIKFWTSISAMFVFWAGIVWWLEGSWLGYLAGAVFVLLVPLREYIAKHGEKLVWRELWWTGQPRWRFFKRKAASSRGG